MAKRKWVKPELFLVTPDGKRIPLSEMTGDEMNQETNVDRGKIESPTEEERTIP